MWTAKIEFDGSNCVLGKLCVETKAEITVYPLHHSYKNNELLVTIIGNIHGNKKIIDHIVKLINNSNLIKHFELSTNIFVCKFKEEEKLHSIYSSEIIFLNPHTIDKTGKETIHIASFKKSEINKIYTLFNKLYNAKIKFIKQEKINNMSFISKTPELTEIQKNSIIFAFNEGYYNFPRNTSLQDLANKKKLSFSTFQAHLRKAEKKLIPFWLKKL